VGIARSLKETCKGMIRKAAWSTGLPQAMERMRAQLERMEASYAQTLGNSTRSLLDRLEESTVSISATRERTQALFDKFEAGVAADARENRMTLEKWCARLSSETKNETLLLLEKIDTAVSRVDRGTQLLLGIKYRELFGRGILPGFGDIEFRNYSQNGEDGILWYIFSLVGTRNKECVEICAGSGQQCNCANLIIDHGWTGLLFDGNEELIRLGNEFYKAGPDTFVYPPRLVHAWVTAENVNTLIASNGIQGEIDLLSLDIDGVDYWLWDAIDVISPRVVVAEIQAIWGCDKSVTVPYSPDFKAEFCNGFGIYSGASLPAFVKLGKKKGYRLIGCQRYGFNAFFLREDVGRDVFPEIDPEQCFYHPFTRWAYDELRPMVLERPWQEV